MKLLSVGVDSKTIKGEKIGFLTGILYLAPSTMAGCGINTCASASEGCKRGCLFTAGRAGIFKSINRARIRKTRMLFSDRKAFLEILANDIRALVRMAARRGLTPCVRVNGTSDLPWLARTMARMFPTVQLYDYTKHLRPWERVLPNYYLTFSLSECNENEALEALIHGINVSIPFNVKRGQALPSHWRGYEVIDGDVSDVRHLDPRGVVVGLRAKGRARKDTSGFVRNAQLVQIQNQIAA